MPLPTPAERAAARERNLKRQAARNAAAFKASGSADHDLEAAKTVKAERQKAQATKAAGRPKRAGSSRTVMLPSSKKA